MVEAAWLARSQSGTDDWCGDRVAAAISTEDRRNDAPVSASTTPLPERLALEGPVSVDEGGPDLEGVVADAGQDDPVARDWTFPSKSLTELSDSAMSPAGWDVAVLEQASRPLPQGCLANPTPSGTQCLAATSGSESEG